MQVKPEETIIINIVSPSGGGKTSIVKELEKKYKYNPIHSYTTRPQRYEGEYGHIFIDVYSDVNGCIKTGDKTFCKSEMIAYFNSYSSGHHYFITDELVKRGEVNLYVVDPGGARQVERYYKDSDVEVVTIFISVDETIRAERLVRRENNGYCITPKDNPNVWARIRPDRKIFETIKCDYTVNGNKQLDKVVKLVHNVIQEVKQNKEE